MTSIYHALDLGKVSVVIPLSSTGHCFADPHCALLARRRAVTLRIIISACMIVGGVVLISGGSRG